MQSENIDLVGNNKSQEFNNVINDSGLAWIFGEDAESINFDAELTTNPWINIDGDGNIVGLRTNLFGNEMYKTINVELEENKVQNGYISIRSHNSFGEFIGLINSVLSTDFCSDGNLIRELKGGRYREPLTADANKLLYLMMRHPYANDHLGVAINVLHILINGEITGNQRKQLAKHCIHTILPLVKCYEFPALQSALELECIKILDQNAYNLASKLYNEKVGNLSPRAVAKAVEWRLKSELNEIDLDIEYELRIRAKSPLSLVKKFSNGRSLDDWLGATIALDNLDLERFGVSTNDDYAISNFINNNILDKLRSRGFIVELEDNDDTFINHRGYNPHYKVVKTYITLPGKPFPKFEVQFTTRLNDLQNRADHPWLKVVGQLATGKVGIDPEIIILGDYARQLYSHAKGTSNQPNWILPSGKTMFSKYQNVELALCTVKGTHTIFFKNEDVEKNTHEELLINFAKSIHFTSDTFIVGCRVHRITSRGLEVYEVDLRTHEVFKVENGVRQSRYIGRREQLGTNVEIFNTLTLKDFDRIELLELAPDNSHFVPYLTINDVLDTIGEADNPEAIDLDLLKSRYPLLTFELVNALWNDLKRIHELQQLPNSSLRKEANKSYQLVWKSYKPYFVRRELIDLLKEVSEGERILTDAEIRTIRKEYLDGNNDSLLRLLNGQSLEAIVNLNNIDLLSKSSRFNIRPKDILKHGKHWLGIYHRVLKSGDQNQLAILKEQLQDLENNDYSAYAAKILRKHIEELTVEL